MLKVIGYIVCGIVFIPSIIYATVYAYYGLFSDLKAACEFILSFF